MQVPAGLIAIGPFISGEICGEVELDLWQPRGLYDNSSRDHKAAWNLTSNIAFANGAPSRLRFATIFTHWNEGFQALIQNKSSTQSLWERMKTVGWHGGGKKYNVFCNGMAGDDITTSEDLERCVGEVNDEYE